MISSSSYLTAVRTDGVVCHGTVWRRPDNGKTDRVCDYAVLSGTRLDGYASQPAFTRGEAPIASLEIVGASPAPEYGSSALSSTAKDTFFRIVTTNGTHWIFQAVSGPCRKTWLQAIQAGLELAWLDSSTCKPEVLQPPKPGVRMPRRLVCFSCGAVDTSKQNRRISGGPKIVLPNAAPATQYGKETRVNMCLECDRAQGLWNHVRQHRTLLQTLQYEQEAIAACQQECWKILRGEGSEQDQEEKKLEQQQGADSSETATPNPNEADAASDYNLSSTPLPSNAHELISTIAKDPDRFGKWSRHSQLLDRLGHQFLYENMIVEEFLEELDEAAVSTNSVTLNKQAALKTQAFRAAGDMTSALRLLLEYCGLNNANGAVKSPSNAPQRRQDQRTDLVCLLNFLLDLCENGDELQSIAFFWPQLCHLHLRLLPAETIAQAAIVELLEDFLITIATRYSIQLALELVWSHTADLEEAFDKPAATESAETENFACLKRRYAVLRFVCELESQLFDLDGGWGGGHVTVGKLFTPTRHQSDLIRKDIAVMQRIRQRQPLRLVSSARLDNLRGEKRCDIEPELAVQEKMRIAKNADYFSCHWIFTRRLSDIAEKLRFMEVGDRRGALEEELNLINASGTMGGDPLNLVRDSYLRVIRIPSTEGHVFRSKERTPVLLLMEVEGDSILEAAPDTPLKKPVQIATEQTIVENSGEQSKATEGGKPDQKNDDSPSTPRRSFVEAEDEDRTPKRKIWAMIVVCCNLHRIPLLILSFSLYLYVPLNAVGALKRFDSRGTAEPEVLNSGTPKKDVELLVQNNETCQKLQKLQLPALNSQQPCEATRDTTTDESIKRITSTSSIDSTRSPKEGGQRSGSRMLGNLKGEAESDSTTNTLAPTGDIRREVLTTIMMQGKQGNTIASGTAVAVQRSLKELERKRATELLLQSDETDGQAEQSSDDKRDNLVSLGLTKDSEDKSSQQTEEDEVMEAIRLLMIQNRVDSGQLTPADAAKVLQHASLNRVASEVDIKLEGKTDADGGVETVDAGDVDRRLVGCGPMPPAVYQAVTLWKSGLVTNAELLELVKKDVAFVRHSVLLDSENVDKLQEDSAFWGRFAFGERWAEKKSRIAATSPKGSAIDWDLVGVIVKSNDDLRQEAFIMQLITLCQESFEVAGLELWVSPYRILATGRTTGVIEMVRNAMSFDALKKRPGYGSLREHLQRMTEFTADPGESFKTAQLNFVRSLAAYSLMSYFFLFKDRHNGNILLDTAGHVIHIDFGFVFGIAPGGSFSLEMSTPFKLTEEMLDVMGGLKSPLFSEFVTLFCCGFLALQTHCDTFLTIVEITCKNSTFKCFEGKSAADFLSKLRERFCPDYSKEETVAFALDLIRQATTSYGTRQYDLFQYMSQGIAA